MASNVATLAIKVTTDADKAAADLENVGRSASGFQSGLNKAAAGAAVAGAAIAAFGKSALDAASSSEQAAGAVDAVYGQTASTIHAVGGEEMCDGPSLRLAALVERALGVRPLP